MFCIVLFFLWSYKIGENEIFIWREYGYICLNFIDNIKYRNIYNIICMYIRLVKYKYILEKKNVYYMYFVFGYVIIKLLYYNGNYDWKRFYISGIKIN